MRHTFRPNLKGKVHQDVETLLRLMQAEIDSLHRKLAPAPAPAKTSGGGGTESSVALLGAFAQPDIATGSSVDPSLSTLSAMDGTVVSVAFSATPSGIFNSNVTDPTSAPNISLSMDNQNANKVLAGPSSGGAATPAFRSLVDADMPAEEVKTDNALTKVTAGAPYANDGYVVLKDHAGNSIKVMTTA